FWTHLLLPEYPESSFFIKLLALSLPMLVWTSVAVNVLRFERKAKLAVALSLTQSLLLILLNILFVLILKRGVEGVYNAQLSAAFLTMPLAMYFIRNWIGTPKWFDKKTFKEMFRY